MDGSAFDHLTLTLPTARFRRRTLDGMLAGGSGLLRARVEDAGTHDLKSTCKKKLGAAK